MVIDSITSSVLAGWLVVVLVIIFLNLAIFFRQSQTGRIFMYTLDGIRACFLSE